MQGALSPKEAAAWLGVSVDTVERLLRDGRIPYVRLGPRVRRIPVSALERLFDQPAQEGEGAA